jgi:hypothetical protein
MKRILLHSRELQQNSIFDPDVRDNMYGPYIALRRVLRERGYDLMTSDCASPAEAEWVLFFDAFSVYPPKLVDVVAEAAKKRRRPAPWRNLYAECIAAGLADRVALFLWEGPAYEPRNWQTKLHQMFSVIFTWDDSKVDNRKYFKVFYPQPERFATPEPVPFAKKKLLVCISGNKFSTASRELYSERRKSIRYFEAHQPDSFDLYGIFWDRPTTITAYLHAIGQPRYTSYRGPVDHKWNVFPRYRFALCYENIRDEVGYVTEKIFDCMRADCVPIYWGAKNVRDFIPPETFVDRTAFANNKELESFIAGVTETEYERYRSAIQDFLHGDRFRLFSEANFTRLVTQVLLR